jgi:hypothetical protein
MNRRVAIHQIRTISDCPLLVGESLRRAELRNVRRSKRRAFFAKANNVRIGENEAITSWDGNGDGNRPWRRLHNPARLTICCKVHHHDYCSS